jgi:hypothetical protein
MEITMSEVQQYVDALKVDVEPHVKAIAKAILEKSVFPAIEKAVADSENKIDDILAASLVPLMKQAAHAAIDAVKL